MREKEVLWSIYREGFISWEKPIERKMKDILEDWQKSCHVKGVNEEGIILFQTNKKPSRTIWNESNDYLKGFTF